MALQFAGVQCEIREVLLKDKPAALLEISPKATVPVLQLPDGRVIDESLDIMRWALAGRDAWQCTDTMADLIGENDDAFKIHLDRYKYPQRFDGVDADVHFQAAGVFLAQLEQCLQRSTFLFGRHASIADAAIFPFVRQFAAVDQQAFGALPFVHLQQWLAHWLADTAFQNIMLKRQPWQSGDEAVFLL